MKITGIQKPLAARVGNALVSIGVQVDTIGLFQGDMGLTLGMVIQGKAGFEAAHAHLSLSGWDIQVGMVTQGVYKINAAPGDPQIH